MYLLFLFLSYLLPLTPMVCASEPDTKHAAHFTHIAEHQHLTSEMYDAQHPLQYDRLTLTLPDPLGKRRDAVHEGYHPNRVIYTGLGLLGLGYAAPYLTEIMRTGFSSAVDIFSRDALSHPGPLFKLLGIGTCVAGLAWYWPQRHEREMHALGVHQDALADYGQGLRSAHDQTLTHLSTIHKSSLRALHRASYSVLSLTQFYPHYGATIRGINANYDIAESALNEPKEKVECDAARISSELSPRIVSLESTAQTLEGMLKSNAQVMADLRTDLESTNSRVAPLLAPKKSLLSFGGSSPRPLPTPRPNITSGGSHSSSSSLASSISPSTTPRAPSPQTSIVTIAIPSDQSLQTPLSAIPVATDSGSGSSSAPTMAKDQTKKDND